ncbi:serine protease HTRA2, mitochondrial-like [Agrilus planipennis]|uniref:Serine protease HTRA2, mitochondrial n=1 Tax=Agrilus planipennis TaxID=224129 RepID=A0A1W4WVI6_AGRPL|nr:serine protease HTRA2, mitochondrial-like [Agrilus planipennis]
MRKFLDSLRKAAVNYWSRVRNLPTSKNELINYCAVGVSCSVLSSIFFWYIKTNADQYSFLFKNNAVYNRISKSSPRETFNFIGSVVKKCVPSVVFVEIKDRKKLDPIFGIPMIVSNGSGFIVRNDGLIITNAHVVMSKPNALITVTTHDGKIYDATVENADLNTDLALLKINPSRSLPVANLGTAKDLSIGEWVVALGNPLSLTHTATVGVVSSVTRSAQELGLSNLSMRYIQTDASITFGNSGGPLVNLEGDVVGINNLRVTAGISFAIPVDYAKDFIDKYSNTKAIPMSSRNMDEKCIGIATFDISTDLVKYLLQEHKLVPEDISHGVYVWKVAPNTPAFVYDKDLLTRQYQQRDF